MATHKERVEKVQNFASKNKVFTVFAIVITLFLLSNFIFSKVNQDESVLDSNTSQSENTEEVPTEKHTEDDTPHWRFYWIDLWILAGAGGFCSAMIIRERKKARDELQ